MLWKHCSSIIKLQFSSIVLATDLKHSTIPAAVKKINSSQPDLVQPKNLFKNKSPSYTWIFFTIMPSGTVAENFTRPRGISYLKIPKSGLKRNKQKSQS